MLQPFPLPHDLSPETTIALDFFIKDIESKNASAECKAHRISALRLLYTIVDIIIQFADGRVKMDHLQDFWISLMPAEDEAVTWKPYYGWPATLERARRNVYQEDAEWEASLPDTFWADAIQNERLLDMLYEDRDDNRLLFEKAASYFKNLPAPDAPHKSGEKHGTSGPRIDSDLGDLLNDLSLN